MAYVIKCTGRVLGGGGDDGVLEWDMGMQIHTKTDQNRWWIRVCQMIKRVALPKPSVPPNFYEPNLKLGNTTGVWWAREECLEV